MDRTKKRAAVILLVAALSAPTTVRAHQEDWCTMGRRMGMLATMNAFAFGLIPALQPVGIIFAGVAIGFKVMEEANCH